MGRAPITWKNISGAGLSQSLNTAIAANRTLQQSVKGIGTAFDEWGSRRKEDFTADTLAQLGMADSAGRDKIIAGLSAPGQTRRFDAKQITALDQQMDQKDFQGEKFDYQKDWDQSQQAYREGRDAIGDTQWGKNFNFKMTKERQDAATAAWQIEVDAINKRNLESQRLAESNMGKATIEPLPPRPDLFGTAGGYQGQDNSPGVVSQNLVAGANGGVPDAAVAMNDGQEVMDQNGNLVIGGQDQGQGQSNEEFWNQVPEGDRAEFQKYAEDMAPEEAAAADEEMARYNTPEAQLLYSALDKLPIAQDKKDRMFEEALNRQQAQQQAQGAQAVQGAQGAQAIQGDPKTLGVKLPGLMKTVEQHGFSMTPKLQQGTDNYNKAIAEGGAIGMETRAGRALYNGTVQALHDVVPQKAFRDTTETLNKLVMKKDFDKMSEKERLEASTEMANLYEKHGLNEGGLAVLQNRMQGFLDNVVNQLPPTMGTPEEIKEKLMKDTELGTVLKAVEKIQDQAGKLAVVQRDAEYKAQAESKAKVDAYILENKDDGSWEMKGKYPWLSSQNTELDSIKESLVYENPILGTDPALGGAILNNVSKQLNKYVSGRGLGNLLASFENQNSDSVSKGELGLIATKLLHSEIDRIQKIGGDSVFSDESYKTFMDKRKPVSDPNLGQLTPERSSNASFGQNVKKSFNQWGDWITRPDHAAKDAYHAYMKLGNAFANAVDGETVAKNVGIQDKKEIKKFEAAKKKWDAIEKHRGFTQEEYVEQRKEFLERWIMKHWGMLKRNLAMNTDKSWEDYQDYEIGKYK